jgi:hypothetical protein
MLGRRKEGGRRERGGRKEGGREEGGGREGERREEGGRRERGERREEGGREEEEGGRGGKKLAHVFSEQISFPGDCSSNVLLSLLESPKVEVKWSLSRYDT